jgi:predicted DNA-binding ribbon-helix-helix protein
MVRTQIQLTETQATALRAMAAAQNVSMAELIRRSVDQLVHEQANSGLAARVARAKAAVGRFSSGKADISSRHDEYLAEAFDSR